MEQTANMSERGAVRSVFVRNGAAQLNQYAWETARSDEGT